MEIREKMKGLDLVLSDVGGESTAHKFNMKSTAVKEKGFPFLSRILILASITGKSKKTAANFYNS